MRATKEPRRSRHERASATACARRVSLTQSGFELQYTSPDSVRSARGQRNTVSHAVMAKHRDGPQEASNEEARELDHLHSANILERGRPRNHQLSAHDRGLGQKHARSGRTHRQQRRDRTTKHEERADHRRVSLLDRQAGEDRRKRAEADRPNRPEPPTHATGDYHATIVLYLETNAKHAARASVGVVMGASAADRRSLTIGLRPPPADIAARSAGYEPTDYGPGDR